MLITIKVQFLFIQFWVVKNQFLLPENKRYGRFTRGFVSLPLYHHVCCPLTADHGDISIILKHGYVSHNQRVNPVNHPFQTPKLPRSSLKISLYILHGLSCRHFSRFNPQLYPYVYMRFLAYPMKYP